MLTEAGGRGRWLGMAPVGLSAEGDPTAMLAEVLQVLHTARLPGLPPLTGGLVGMISYDAVRRWERVPDNNPDVLGLPELAMFLATDLAVLDHRDGSVLLVANAINYDDRPSGSRPPIPTPLPGLDRMTADLEAGREPMLVACDPGATPDYVSTTPREEYLAGWRRPRSTSAPVMRSRSFLTAIRGSDDSGRPGHLPGAPRDQPKPLHVPLPVPRSGRPDIGRRALLRGGFRCRGIQPGGVGEAGRWRGDAAPDCRHQTARRHPGAGRPAG